jgi:hypothetical protein
MNTDKEKFQIDLCNAIAEQRDLYRNMEQKSTDFSSEKGYLYLKEIREIERNFSQLLAIIQGTNPDGSESLAEYQARLKQLVSEERETNKPLFQEHKFQQAYEHVISLINTLDAPKKQFEQAIQIPVQNNVQEPIRMEWIAIGVIVVATLLCCCICGLSISFWILLNTL